jgi:DNA adenine methylase
MTEKLTQPLKWWGGKHYLAPKIIDRMPRHLHYVEPFAGGLAVLLAKDPLDPRHQWGDKGYEQGISEVVNDIHGDLTTFWRVLQGEDTFAAFARRIDATPFSQVEWEEAAEPTTDPVERAARFFIRCRQSRAGQFRDFATLSRNRTRRRMNEQASAWMTAVAGLSAVASRLRRAVVLCDDALNVIRAQDGEKTLFYLDPPYLHETRTSTDTYQHEFTEDQHRELLATVKRCEGRVMLSGYPSELYARELAGWTRHAIEIDNKAAGGASKRTMTECLWMNYDPPAS